MWPTDLTFTKVFINKVGNVLVLNRHTDRLETLFENPVQFEPASKLERCTGRAIAKKAPQAVRYLLDTIAQNLAAILRYAASGLRRRS